MVVGVVVTAETERETTNAKQASNKLTVSMAKGTTFCGILPLKRFIISFYCGGVFVYMFTCVFVSQYRMIK
jgi:hypothetical protein